jgi:hypothetical protein
MLRSRASRIAGGLAAAAAATLITAASPADAAVVVPDWPAGGRAPSGCATTTIGGSFPTAWNMTFTDTTAPTVTDVSVNAATSLVIPPAGTVATFMAHLDQQCSGSFDAVEAIVRGKGIDIGVAMSALTTNPFSQDFGYSVRAMAIDAGAYSVPLVVTRRRYDSFTLDSSFALTAKTDAVGVPDVLVGPWSTKTLYLLRQTRLTINVKSTTVTRGKAVTLAGVLRYAGAAAGQWLADNGEKVVVQTKVGTGPWTKRATLTANASGVVAWSFKPKVKTSVRFVHTVTHSGRFTAPVVSAVKVISVR